MFAMENFNGLIVFGTRASLCCPRLDPPVRKPCLKQTPPPLMMCSQTPSFLLLSRLTLLTRLRFPICHSFLGMFSHTRIPVLLLRFSPHLLSPYRPLPSPFQRGLETDKTPRKNLSPSFPSFPEEGNRVKKRRAGTALAAAASLSLSLTRGCLQPGQG